MILSNDFEKNLHSEGLSLMSLSSIQPHPSEDLGISSASGSKFQLVEMSADVDTSSLCRNRSLAEYGSFVYRILSSKTAPEACLAPKVEIDLPCQAQREENSHCSDPTYLLIKLHQSIRLNHQVP